MFLKMKTKKSMNDCLDKLKQVLNDADAIVIGAGSGLSTSAGFTYSGYRFEKYFSDFIEKYHFRDMYSGGFYHFNSLEEYWAYWSRYIYINRYMDPIKPTYSILLDLMKDKEYFVITTNVDHCFQKAGFDKKRLFYTQGDYGLFQCCTPCCNETYENKEVILEMIHQQTNRRIPTKLIPYCPHCGEAMIMNLRADTSFVEDQGWHEALHRYQMFLNQYKDKKIVFLELGVGYNTPGIIKYPFWQRTEKNNNAIYACINQNQIMTLNSIENRSILIQGDITNVLERLLI